MQVFLINLPERPDKFNGAMRELSKIPNIATVVKPIKAIKAAPGWDGCRLSHLLALNEAPRAPFMIVEDDFVFEVENPEPLIKQALAELPETWDLLYLGATLNQDLDKFSDNLYRLSDAWTTHAIIYNGESSVIERIIKDNAGGRKIDVYYAEVIQQQFNCYLSSQLIANQRNGKSDILNRHVNTGNIIRERFIKHTNND